MVISNNFLHPNHVIPAVELVSAFLKFSDFFESEVCIVFVK